MPENNPPLFKSNVQGVPYSKLWPSAIARNNRFHCCVATMIWKIYRSTAHDLIAARFSKPSGCDERKNTIDRKETNLISDLRAILPSSRFCDWWVFRFDFLFFFIFLFFIFYKECWRQIHKSWMHLMSDE
jgi:hypothetical protein